MIGLNVISEVNLLKMQDIFLTVLMWSSLFIGGSIFCSGLFVCMWWAVNELCGKLAGLKSKFYVFGDI